MGRFFPCYFSFHNFNNNPHDTDHQPPSPPPPPPPPLLDYYLQYADSPSNLSHQPTLQSILFEPPSSLETCSSTSTTTTTSTTHHHLVATFKGHTAFLFSLTLAGKSLFTASSDGQIRVWDPNPSSHANSLVFTNNNTVVKGRSAVKAIAVDAAGEKLFAAHQDNKIRVWKIDSSTTTLNLHKSYQLITTLPTVTDRCTRFFSTKDYVRTRRHKKRTWVHHMDTISALGLSKDGSLLYSVSWDRTIKMWSTKDFKCLESVENAHDDAINDVVLSDTGFVYTASADKKIKVWKRVNGEKKLSLLSTLEKHESAVNALALSGDGSVLYSGGCDTSVVAWEMRREVGDYCVKVVGVLRGHGKAVLCLCVVSDLVCSGSADKSVRIWRSGSGGSYFCLAVFEGHRSPVKCLTAANIVSGDDDKGVSVVKSGSNELENCYLVYSGSLDFDVKVWQIWVPL